MIGYFIGIIILLLVFLAYFMPALGVLLNGGEIIKTLNFGSHSVFQGINAVIDPISAFFILIILVMGIISMVYAKGYLKPYVAQGKNINYHIMFFVTLVLSMLAVVTCQNALFFIVCWEIMSLSSFFLVIFENDKKEILDAGVKYLVFMHISVLFIIVVFAILSIKSGSYDFASFAPILKSNRHFADVIFLLAFIGFGIKSGFVPFHNWLPDAHPAAPSHVSAIMSGVMIKTGVYGILRIISLIGAPSKFIAYFVLIISLITALYGVLYAISQNDFKRMLAYSSIENMGIIGIGLGVGLLGLAYNQPVVALLGFTGSALHTLNHSIFKELLFFAAGNIYIKTHTKNMEALGGLIKTMPCTAGFCLLASLAICALPPLNGFISEVMIYFGLFKGLEINVFSNFIILAFAIASLALVGTMAILCFTKAFSVIFLGNPRDTRMLRPENDCDIFMLAPMGVLSIMALIIGLFPQYVVKMLSLPVFHVVSAFHVQNPAVMQTTKTLSKLMFEQAVFLQTLCFIALALLICIGLLMFLKLSLYKKIEKAETWGCGYNKADYNAQYTASSYVSPFLSMLKPLFKNVFNIEKPKKIFPSSAHFSVQIEDIEEAYLIKPVLKFDEWFLSKFEKLQDGNLQAYIKYGLIFLAIVLISVILGSILL